MYAMFDNKVELGFDTVSTVQVVQWAEGAANYFLGCVDDPLELHTHRQYASMTWFASLLKEKEKMPPDL